MFNPPLSRSFIKVEYPYPASKLRGLAASPGLVGQFRVAQAADSVSLSRLRSHCFSSGLGQLDSHQAFGHEFPVAPLEAFSTCRLSPPLLLLRSACFDVDTPDAGFEPSC